MPENYAQTERAALCDLFIELGPDAPTLCAGWTTRDMAAHLVVRESRPDAALGILAAPFASYGERVRKRFATKDWDQLVSLVRNGPPIYSVMKPGFVDRAANTLEYFVHHEDVRRAQPEWDTRTLPNEQDDERWKIVKRMAKVLVRKSPVGVVLAADKREPLIANGADPAVEVQGPVGDLVMFIEGRQRAARVELIGPSDAIDALNNAKFGI